MMQFLQAIFLQCRQGELHHSNSHQICGNNKACPREVAHLGSNNKAYLRGVAYIDSNNKAYLRDKAPFRRSSQVPLLVFGVINTVENMEDVLSNATRIVCVGSGARTPSVILQFSGNRLLLQPSSHV